MKNFNYNSYQAYYSQQQQPDQQQQQRQPTQQRQRQHNQLYQQRLQTQLQQQPPPPTLTNGNTLQQQQTQQQTQHPTTTASTANTNNTNNTSAMSSLTTANFAQNQYNLDNVNYNNYLTFMQNRSYIASNNVHTQQQPQQQQQQQSLQLQSLPPPPPLQQPLQQQQKATRPSQLQLPALPANQYQQQQLQQQQPHQHLSHDSNNNAASAGSDKFTMDACEIANFLANELFMQQLVSVDGIQSGVPTLTTSTLTPTTLRSIEETFQYLTSETINPPYQAGFIPPPCAPFSSTNTSNNNSSSINNNVSGLNDSLQDLHDVDTDSEDSQGSWNVAANMNEDNSMATTDTSSAATDSTSFQNGFSGLASLATSNASSTNDFTAHNSALSAAKNSGHLRSSTPNKNSNTSAPSRRNHGGRRPTKASNLSPEEEEKRRIRRERNKLAAARCRKRRVDQTNELLEEVGKLERIRDGLQADIGTLNTTKKELEFLLESHRPMCQKVRQDIMSVATFGGLIAPATTPGGSSTITGLDSTLASTGRSGSPLDIKPVIRADAMLNMVQNIKNEPLDSALDSSSSLDHDGPPSPKRMLLSNNNPTMLPMPLPNVATLSASLAAAAASASSTLNTPIHPTAPVSFGSLSSNTATLNTLNTLQAPAKPQFGSKLRPNSLPTMPRNLGLHVDGKQQLTDINGVAIQTPSTGMFNFDSLMDGGTGLTPVSGPLVPTCSSQNKHPLEINTPTTEPSKLVSL